jgi:hypothetical protein
VATTSRPLGPEHPLDATPYFFVGEVLAALQLGFAELHGFEKAGLFFQILADRFLRQRIRVSSSVAGQLRQFGGLLGVEMYFRGLRSEVTIGIVKLQIAPVCKTGSMPIEVAEHHRAGTCPALLITSAELAASSYSVVASAALLMAMVSATSPTLKRANRRTEMFSPSLPTTEAISWCTVMVWSLMKGCSYRQTSS